jgi:hypothetical protein
LTEGHNARPTAVSRIEALDTSVFAIQPGHYSDRTSFLRVQRLVRTIQPDYAYLEVGSDLGGSLLPHLLDPACRVAVSVDPRPESQPDERGSASITQAIRQPACWRNLANTPTRKNWANS